MKILELFCGTKSVSGVFKSHGWEIFTVDFESKFNPDICIDVLDLKIKDLPKEWRNPDVVWASPPCTTFSVAAISHYWDNSKPKSWKTYIGLAIAKKTVELIEELNPRYYFIENPRDMLRKQHFMMKLHRKTLTYCQYGMNYQKTTDIWTNAYHWIPKPKCSKNSPCHEMAKRSSKTGLQGVKGREGRIHPDWGYAVDRKGGDAMMRAVIPKLLCEEIYQACNGGGDKVQLALTPFAQATPSQRR